MTEELKPIPDDVLEKAGMKPITTHDHFSNFLRDECSVPREDFEKLIARMEAWGIESPTQAAVNEFNPIMLLEQCRREFDASVDFVTFALAAADLQWGPRLMPIGGYDKPVWIIALKGFPAMIAAAQAHIAKKAANG